MGCCRREGIWNPKARQASGAMPKSRRFRLLKHPHPPFTSSTQPTTLHRQPTNSRQHQYNPASTITGFCNLENSSSNGSKGHPLLLLLPRTIFETKHPKIPRPDPQNNGMTGNQKTLYASGPDTRWWYNVELGCTQRCKVRDWREKPEAADKCSSNVGAKWINRERYCFSTSNSGPWARYIICVVLQDVEGQDPAPSIGCCAAIFGHKTALLLYGRACAAVFSSLVSDPFHVQFRAAFLQAMRYLLLYIFWSYRLSFTSWPNGRICPCYLPT